MTPSKGANEQERAALAEAFGQQMVEPGDGGIDLAPKDDFPPMVGDDGDDGDDENWEDDPAIEAITAGLRDIMDAR